MKINILDIPVTQDSRIDSENLELIEDLFLTYDLTIWEAQFIDQLHAILGQGLSLSKGQEKKLKEVHSRYMSGL